MILARAALLDHGGADRSAGKHRRAGRDLGPVADHQHLGELDRGPGLAGSFSTEITSSLATLYCLPPVRITANMTLADMGFRAPGRNRRTAQYALDGPPRPRAAHYTLPSRSENNVKFPVCYPTDLADASFDA